MELKLTTKRALEFEERTGKDVITFLQEVAKTKKVSIRDIVELFVACGENYTYEMFDQWDGTFVEKSAAIIKAVGEYVGKAPKK